MCESRLTLLILFTTTTMALPRDPEPLDNGGRLRASMERESESRVAEEAAFLAHILPFFHLDELEEQENLAKRREYVDKEDDWLWVHPAEPPTDFLASRRRHYPSKVSQELVSTEEEQDKGEEEKETYLELDKRPDDDQHRRQRLLDVERADSLDNIESNIDDEERQLLLLRRQLGRRL